MKSSVRNSLLGFVGIACAVGALVYMQSRPLYRPSETVLREIFPDGQKETLEKSDTFVLYAISPEPVSTKDTFHGYRVKGKVELPDEKRDRVLSHLYAGFADEELVNNSCFNPRHGIRAVRAGKTVDLVICFGCLSFERYDSPNFDADRVGGSTIDSSPRRAFDDVLSEAGIDDSGA